MGNPYAPRPPGTPPPEPQRLQQPPVPTLTADDGARPAPRPPVDPDAARRATRSVMHFGLLMLACLLTSSLALPWRFVSVAIALVALVVGLRALRRIWRAGLRGFLVVAMSAGVLMTFALALTTLAVIPVWQIEMDRQACLGEAITISATSTCESDYKTAITKYQDSLRN